MSEWKVISLEPPDAVQGVLNTAASIIDGVVAFLEAIETVMELVADIAEAAVDAYTALVSAFIDEVQALLNDLRYAGIYVLVDYPNTLTPANFNPVSEQNLAGTVFDAETQRLLAQTENENLNDLIGHRRRHWARQQNSFLSYQQAIARVSASFSDPLDHLRPQFSDSAATYGVVIMGYSREVALFVKLCRQLGNLFAINDLTSVLTGPGLEDWLEDFKGDLEDLAQVDFCSFDLSIPFDLRNGGTFPNWIGRMTLQDLVPPLGNALRALSNLIENLRPNGPITDFITDLIAALRKKIERLRQIAETLKELSDLLKDGLSGTKLALVTIQSSTGNNGFINGLLQSTGHPEFEDSLVVTLVLYAGGPNIEPLKLLFNKPGETVPGSNFMDNVDSQRDENLRTVVVP